MLYTPRFRSQFTVEVLGVDTVLFSTESDCFTLQGRLFVLLVPQIDGQRNVDQIGYRLAGRLSRGAIQLGLFCLQEKGCLVEAHCGESNSWLPYADLWDIDPAVARKRLESTPVSVASEGSGSVEPFLAILGSLGIRVLKRGAISIVLASDYLSETLRRYHRRSFQLKKPWMLIKPTGSAMWWGPLFSPGRTGCWCCLATRLLGHLGPERLDSGREKSIVQNGTHQYRLPLLADAALNLAALCILRWIIDSKSKRIENHVFVLNGSSMGVSAHRMMRLSHCPDCGSGDAKGVKTAPVRMAISAQSSDPAGRRLSPAETLEKLEHHISPITGIVSRIETIYETKDQLLHVCSAETLMGETRLSSVARSRRLCIGKGSSLLEARAGALCEAIERYSGCFKGNEPRRKTSYRKLGSAALRPNDLMLFSQTQMVESERSGSYPAPAICAPRPFDESAEIEWTPVWSMTSQDYRFVPTALCYYNYPEEAGRRFCLADSNGNAAGSNIQEAVLSGFLELVERDSVALWWYNRIPRVAVQVETFHEPFIHAVLDHCMSLGRDLTVLDITSDLEVPAFAAISRRLGGNLNDLIMGFGAHLEVMNALRKALGEVVQMLPAIRSGQSTSNFTGLPGDRVIQDDWLVPAEGMHLKTSFDFENSEQVTVEGYLQRCLSIAERHGLETLILDQTREETGCSVVKVFVPGLRPWWARFAPGRLYEVPVKMDWLERRPQEAELSPYHLSL